MMLYWRKGLPDRAGWYWRRDRGAIDIVQLRDFGDGIYAGNTALAGWRRMMNADWAGPLEVPLDYEAPAVTYETQIEVRAGTPLNLLATPDWKGW